MKIKKGDQVLIISGKDRGKLGKVLNVFPKKEKIVVEGANIKKKHVRSKKSGEKGQVVDLPAAISVSDVKFVCPKCGKAARIGYKIVEDKKYKICKQCKEEL